MRRIMIIDSENRDSKPSLNSGRGCVNEIILIIKAAIHFFTCLPAKPKTVGATEQFSFGEHPF